MAKFIFGAEQYRGEYSYTPITQIGTSNPPVLEANTPNKVAQPIEIVEMAKPFKDGYKEVGIMYISRAGDDIFWDDLIAETGIHFDNLWGHGYFAARYIDFRVGPQSTFFKIPMYFDEFNGLSDFKVSFQGFGLHNTPVKKSIIPILNTHEIKVKIICKGIIHTNDKIEFHLEVDSIEIP